MLAASGMPIVRLSNVSKNYGIYQAIDSIDLDIVPGEFITFLGPSGSGKTTTLMMLAGFESPSSGTIEMDGQRIDRLPAHKRNVGVVFQNYALFPHMTVHDNLAFPLKVRRVGAAEIDARVKAALAMVHLDALGDRRPVELSGGQQQRVALARAIIFKPRLIVLDEPLGALDKNLREHLQSELKTLHKDLGTTMVFVTHDQSEALTLSDRVVVFNKGRIEQIDTPENLYERPTTSFVASFIGENNILPARITSIGGNIATVCFKDGGVLRAPSQSWCSVGSDVLYSVRPENIDLARPGAEQTVSARVSDVVYLGEQRRVLVDAVGIGQLSFKTRVGSKSLIAQGSEISLEISAAASRVLPVE